MTGEITPLVVALKTVTLLLGGLITYFAASAAVTTEARPLQLLAVGFATVTLGSLSAGVADQILSVDTGTALVAESALTAVGFAIITYSLYVASRSSLGGR
ncbi:DUF7521 family protein [Haloarcula litorea]|uniref:DUF7521 family protein n=1 Tax=Haloarcula litorea TaxID=3032579 RepID=UPI0023E8CE47|nr:hypothetical protein [Halomicroarcula sp. GDY20]